MSTLDFEYYPFDPTGTAVTNAIKKEPMVLTAANYRDYHYIIPRFAPFFEATLVVRIRQNGATRVLRPGVDYYVANKFRDASLACAKEIFGSISFLDTSLTGTLELDYQSIGGKWNITEEQIAAILAEEVRNPRIITWEQVANPPWRFPVIDHIWDLADMTGMADVKTAVDAVTAAILEASGGSTTGHINDFNNPHKTTKDHVGLGLVLNYSIASVQEAQDGIANNRYMTPARTRTTATAVAASLLREHTDNVQNPHNTNKGHVGLGLVENYRVATNQEAIDGVMGQAYMTPALVRAAINASASDVSNHLSNMNNPHGVTKAQVGLNLVQNFSIANKQEAEDGVLNNRYMTPFSTKALVLKYVSTELDSHATLTNNPHKVDKDQVGLSNVMNYGIATTVDMTNGTAIDKYVTPFLIQKKLEAYVPTLISGHVDDFDNPHSVTASQVGAYSREQIDARLLNYYLKGSAVDNSLLWNGSTHENYRDWLYTNMPDFNAKKFDGRNYTQVRDDILSFVDDSFLLSEFHEGTEPTSVAGETVPFAIMTRVRSGLEATSPVTTMDRAFVIFGANKINDGEQSTTYGALVVASVRQDPGESPVVRMHPFYAMPKPIGLKVGYLWDDLSETLTLVVSSSSNSESFNVIDLSGQSPNSGTVPPRYDGEDPNVTVVQLTPAPSTVDETEIENMKIRIGAAETDISSLNTKTDNTNSSLTNLTNRVGDCESTLITHSGAISTNTTDITGVKTRLSTAETGVAANKTAIEGINTKLTDHETRLDNLEAGGGTAVLEQRLLLVEEKLAQLVIV